MNWNKGENEAQKISIERIMNFLFAIGCKDVSDEIDKLKNKIYLKGLRGRGYFYIDNRSVKYFEGYEYGQQFHCSIDEKGNLIIRTTTCSKVPSEILYHRVPRFHKLFFYDVTNNELSRLYKNSSIFQISCLMVLLFAIAGYSFSTKSDDFKNGIFKFKYRKNIREIFYDFVNNKITVYKFDECGRKKKEFFINVQGIPEEFKEGEINPDNQGIGVIQGWSL